MVVDTPLTGSASSNLSWISLHPLQVSTSTLAEADFSVVETQVRLPCAFNHVARLFFDFLPRRCEFSRVLGHRRHSVHSHVFPLLTALFFQRLVRTGAPSLPIAPEIIWPG